MTGGWAVACELVVRTRRCAGLGVAAYELVIPTRSALAVCPQPIQTSRSVSGGMTAFRPYPGRELLARGQIPESAEYAYPSRLSQRSTERSLAWAARKAANQDRYRFRPSTESARKLSGPNRAMMQGGRGPVSRAHAKDPGGFPPGS